MAMGVTQELCFSTLAIHLCSVMPLLLSICWSHFFLKAICSFYNALSKYMISRFFFFYSSLFSWTQIVVLLLHSNSNFLFVCFYMRQNVIWRWDIWVEVQGKHCGLCAQPPFASGTLEALFSASGFGEKLLKSHCSTEQSVTLWIIVY